MRKEERRKVPSWAYHFLQWYCKEELFDEISGDLYESYLDRFETHGRQKAQFYYVWTVFSFLRPFAIKSLIMEQFIPSKLLANYIKMAFRQMVKYKLHTALNVIGLSIGLACFTLLFVFEQHEMSYDQFHVNKKEIFRIMRGEGDAPIATTAFGLAPRLQEVYPTYRFVRFFKDRSRTLVKKETEQFYEGGMYWADKEVLNMFSFPLLHGQAETALDAPQEMVLTEEAAHKYFGRADVLGEYLTVNWNDIDYPFEITGVVKSIPSNSHIQFDILISFVSAESLFPGGIPLDWTMTYVHTFVQLPSADMSVEMEERFPKFVADHIGQEENHVDYMGHLQALEGMHFEAETIGDFWATSEKSYGYFALAIGIFILLIGCMNYMNMASAKALDRAKEVGLRKTLGALRKQLIFQFLVESLIFSLSSLILAGMIAYILLPVFNEIMGTSIEWQLALTILPYLLMICIGTGLFSGSYPAFVLSRLNPIENLRARNPHRFFSGENLRKGMVVCQFAISSILILGTIVIGAQMSFIQDQRLGYDKEQIMIIPHGRKIRDNVEKYKASWLENPGISSISVASRMPTERLGNYIQVWKGNGASEREEEAFSISAISMDHDFLDTYDIQIKEGRNFERSMGMDSRESLLINEKAAELLGLEDAVGQSLYIKYRTGKASQPWEERRVTIIGVIENTHFESLHHEIRPVLLFFMPYWYYYIAAKVETENLPQTIQMLEKDWKTFFPDRPLEYFFLDERFQQLYSKEKSWSQAIGIFSGIAILISCLGLFGLATFMFYKKQKEFSIRKILGASSRQLVFLLSGRFMLLVLVANLISWPIAAYLMQDWLSTFAYKVELSWWMFVGTGIMTFFIATLAICMQAYKVANRNPADDLRME